MTGDGQLQRRHVHMRTLRLLLACGLALPDREEACERSWQKILLSSLKMILGGLCRTIYQGLRGWCIYGMSKLLHSVVFEPTDPMWSQNKTIESLCSVVAVERTIESYTANEALHDRSTNSVLDNRSTNKSRESRQAAKRVMRRSTSLLLENY